MAVNLNLIPLWVTIHDSPNNLTKCLAFTIQEAVKPLSKDTTENNNATFSGTPTSLEIELKRELGCGKK